MSAPLQSRADAVLDPTLDRVSRGGPPPGDSEVYAMPATQGQIRFWSLDQLNPGNPALNMPLMWQCIGPLDLARLEQAFSLCVERHEMLRTTFELVDGMLTQIIGPAYRVEIPVENLEHIPDAAHSAQARRAIRAHAAFRMDLRKGPLLELKLLKFTDEHHLLLVTMHHIICDGISLGILLRDAAVFYEALMVQKVAELPELPIQFGDYAVWAEEWRASEEAGRSIEFWRKTLGKDFHRLELHRDSGPSGVLKVESEDDRPGLSAETGDIETLLIPADLTAAAHRFCVRENVTFNILLTSVFTALMSRLSGQLDLVIGSPCGNRNEDTAELIGLFMNIQVMRIQMEQESSFRALLKQVQTWTLGAFENQTLPFEDLVHDTYFGDRHNSFEIPVFFLYQKSFMVTQRVAGLEITPLRSESPGAVFELMFAIVDRAEEGPRLQLEYNPQHFRQSTIQQYLRLYVALLESALTVPDARVDQLWTLSPTDREEIVHGWNRTEVDFGEFESIQSIFMRRAELNPVDVAVVCGRNSWTYAKLNTYATWLAGRLVRQGLKPGGLVGICVERSPEMLGAVLAVLMAGGAYVPLDPRHPVDRLQMVVEDAKMSFLLTRTTKNLDLKTSATVLDLNALPPESGTISAITLPVDCGPDSLAYVIYTSGSTGRPKGVAIEHRALMNLLHSMQREPGLTAKDTLVAITTLAFDIAGLELLLPLLTGARLVIATDAQVYDGNQLAGLIEQSKATVLQATPGAWRMLMDAGWKGERPLKVLCGGEAMPRELANKLLERSNDVWNVYGPTETTIWSSATRVTHGTGPMLLGPPIANTQFYILDTQLRPVPVGVAGDLYIGGAGLARGYWNRPDLTAEKFIKNPFASGRIYNTGDCAMWNANGLMQLLGRSDFQVKIRGYRVELGEIEAVLSLHTMVHEAVVVQRQTKATENGNPIARLVAYVVSPEATEEETEDELVNELNKLLRTKLPDYLCPNAVVVLEAFPRTPNGKIDRKNLPEVFSRAGDNGLAMKPLTPNEFTAPRDMVERQLVEIWQSTLGIPKISTRASFFSLGVGSLAALRLINHMNRVYALDLGLASLISASTIESVADLVRTRFSPNTSSSLVPIQPHGTRPPLFIVHGIGGNIVNFYTLSMRMGREQPVFGVQAQALESKKSALLHLKDMAAHYLEEIRQVQPQGPYYLLGYSFGGTMVLEMAHQLKAAGQQVAMLGMLDSKSQDYLAELSKTITMQSKINRRVGQYKGNTSRLSTRDRIAYTKEKIVTRAIRYSVFMAAALKFKSVPSFMKSATDINYVAAKNYKLSPYDGTLTLFRATEQDDPNAPRELGWDAIFKRGVEVRTLPGDHERIFLEPGIDVLAEGLRDALKLAHAAQVARAGREQHGSKV